MSKAPLPVIEGDKLQEYYPDSQPVATMWRQGTEGTFYWRLLVPARHLPARINSLWFSDVDNPDCMRRQEGVAIWQFLGDLERTRFAARIQSEGVKTLMEVDDNYLIPPPIVPNMRKAWQTTVRRSFERGETGYSHQAHRWLLPSIDGLICSTEELANRYEPLVPAGVYVCPNSVDPADWPRPRVLEEERVPAVGYAGSDSHFYDLFLVNRALDYAHRNGAKLVKFGAHGNTWRWPHEQINWTNDLNEYRQSLQVIDIGLCPVKRSDWHDCKSDIKAMEYLMAGVLPIVQADSPCYRDWLDLVPSASTEKQWERAMKEVLSWSSDERRAVWRKAYDWLLEHKTIHSHVHKWFDAIGSGILLEPTHGGKHESGSLAS